VNLTHRSTEPTPPVPPKSVSRRMIPRNFIPSEEFLTENAKGAGRDNLHGSTVAASFDADPHTKAKRWKLKIEGRRSGIDLGQS
jgi:hypothetical protein